MKQMKILMVVTGTGMFPDGKQETGLWLSELTHIYDRAKSGDMTSSSQVRREATPPSIP